MAPSRSEYVARHASSVISHVTFSLWPGNNHSSSTLLSSCRTTTVMHIFLFITKLQPDRRFQCRLVLLYLAPVRVMRRLAGQVCVFYLIAARRDGHVHTLSHILHFPEFCGADQMSPSWKMLIGTHNGKLSPGTPTTNNRRFHPPLYLQYTSTTGIADRSR